MTYNGPADKPMARKRDAEQLAAQVALAAIQDSPDVVRCDERQNKTSDIGAISSKGNISGRVSVTGRKWEYL